MLFLLMFLLHSLWPDLNSIHIPNDTDQVVLVTTESWGSSNGKLQRFSRSESGWFPVGSEIPVVVGRNGLGWGDGLQAAVIDGPQKKEGDARAPAGVFRFGTTFGYGERPPKGFNMPYRHIGTKDYWVDDPLSPKYNQWVSLDDPSNDPRVLGESPEKMKRDDGLYEFGIVVQYNASPVVKGRGSAIFFHIWRGPGSATIGCTAMAKDDLLTLIRWLEPAKKPLLIQLPQDELNRVRIGGVSGH
jgi:L,D-peptidoglycan transpeptidase YkuD (ErfK/YbiS/YcfS/YnhG family)